MKSLTKIKFCLTRLVMLLLCLWALAPQATADVTIWVYGTTSAPWVHTWTSGVSSRQLNEGTVTNATGTWYYATFTGVSSMTFCLQTQMNSDSDWTNQTVDLTATTGDNYYYYNGSGKKGINLTDCKGKGAYCFLETSPTYWEQASARFQVWDGSADVWMTKVGGIKNGNSIYLYTKASTVTDGTTFYFKRMSSDGSSKWNEGSAPYHLGGYYTNTGWSSVAYQSGSSFGTIVWPEMPVTSTYTVTGIASPTEGGTVTPASTADLETGNTVTLTAAPANGYTFSGWSVSGTTNYTENGNSITVTVASSNVAVTANFAAIPKNYTIHVIEYYANQPTLYVWDSTGNLNGGFPGTLMNQTETSAAGETWYYKSFSTTASTINAIASLGGSSSQTADITGIAPGDYYIVFNGTTKEILSQGTTMPEGKVQYQEPQGFIVNVYDASGAPKVNGTTLSNTTSGTNCQWYTYRYEDTTLPSSVTVASSTGATATLSNPANGQTYYYAWNGYTMQSVNSDYDPTPRSLVYWPDGSNYSDGTLATLTTTDGINYTVSGLSLTGNDWLVFTTAFNGNWDADKGSFYGASSNVTISGDSGNGTGVKGQTGIIHVTKDGIWSFTYNIINNAWTATRTGDLPQNTYNIHVIEYKGGTPYLYVFNAGSANSANFPGSKMTETEVSAAGETWYTAEISTTASTISVIASLGGSSSQTADITGIAPGDYYIVFNGTTKEILSQGTTMPEGKVQAEKNAFTVYVKADAAPYIYLWDDNDVYIENEWPGVQITGAEQLADGTNWWKFVVETYDNDINLLFHNGGGNQSGDITQTKPVAYYVYDGATKCVETVEPTGELYAIGQVAGNPWSANTGLKMTAAADGTTFTLNNVQIIAGATFAFATALGADEDDWTGLQHYRLVANADGAIWEVTSAQTDNENPTAIGLHAWNGADKTLKMDETAYYDITVDMKAMTVTIKRRYGALYMFYGDSDSPYWKPNAGVPMFTTDGKTFMLTNVELDEDDTFQFATQLGADENTWPANIYRYGANSAGNNNWLVTESQIDVVLENALRAETGKDFQMSSGTAGAYRVVVNPEARTVALYRMADVTGSKVIIHLEKTSNVTNPKIWAYDKERDVDDEEYIHEDRPSRIEIATNRHALREGHDPDTIVTVGGRQWWTWEVGKAITDFWFTRNGYDYASVQTTALENEDMTDIQWRRSGEIYLTWPTTGTAMEDHTRDYYAAAAQEAPECAVMIEGHLYAYFTNTPGWEHVFCHAWYTDNQGMNHDLLTPPSPYVGGPCYPGALCEMIGYDKDGYEVWRIDLTAAGVTNYPNGGILFNNGIDDNHVYEHDMNHDYYAGTGTLAAKEQSSDFAYSTGACYDYCGLIVLGRSLSNIIRNGVVDGPIYTIEDDIVGVWVDPNEVIEIEVDGVTRYVYGALYCKDLNNFVTTPYVEKSIQKDGEIDYVLQLTNLMNGKNRYDQSNWVKLTLSTLYPEISSMSAEAQVNLLRLYEGYVLPAESVHAQLVNNVNPEMRIAHALPEPIEENKYRENPNVFTTANFVGTQECDEPVEESGHTERNTYFFVTPKPQEYAKITWAVYAGNDKFYVPGYGAYAYVDGQYEFMNQGNLDGYFPVKWDLMPQVPNITPGEAYWFYAIIRLADENNPAIAGNGPTRTNGEVPYKPYAGTVPYIVYPTNISASSIITAVKDVNTVKTVKQVRYYNLAGVESSEPFDGVNVVVTTYTDGTRTAAKVLK